MSLFQRLGTGLKALAGVVFPRPASWPWSAGFLARTRFDYAREVGDGRGSDIIVACLGWLTRNFVEPPPRVRRPNADGDLDPIPEHPLVQKLRRPNAFYSGTALWSATVADFKLSGNAYWIKARAVAGNVLEYWWIPSTLIEPRWPDAGDVFISHYDYTPSGQGTTAIRLDVQDVVHFRNGIDPQNLRKGQAEFSSLTRQLFSDAEASNMTAALLRNLGTPGALISPIDKETEIAAEDVPQIKAQYQARTTGDQRGEVMVSSRAVKIEPFGFSPEQMNMRAIHRLPEERATAVMGVPAIVVGLGAGLDRSTFANYAEAREAATESALVPLWRIFAEEIQYQVLPDWDDAASAQFDFDLSQVRTLQDDQNALTDRLNKMVLAGRIMVNESRIAQGLPPLDGGDVLYVPINVTITLPEQLSVIPEPTPTPVPEPPKALTVKSASDYVPAMRQLRANLQGRLQRQVTVYLADQQRRVLARVRNDFKAAAFLEHKDYGEEVLDWNEEQRSLEAIFHTAYRQALYGTQGLVEAALSVSFEIDDPLTRAYLQQAGRQIVGITEVTQRAISHTLQEGQAAGEGVDELLQRIQRLTQFSETRAATIARTELGTATNLATVTSFEASGVVVGVRVHDGTDHEPCAGLNGKTFSLAEARGLPPLAHPNCVRALAPLTRAAQLERRSNGNGHVHHAELRELVEVG